MKTALIIGHSGQDGFYLQALLETKGYSVIGVSESDFYCKARELRRGVITDSEYAKYLVNEIAPDEIYYLAAVHHSSLDAVIDDLSLFQKSFAINTLSLVNFLEAMRLFRPSARLFYASSSHIFGKTTTSYQDELTPYSPGDIYAISKVAGMEACKFYREKYNLHASVGIYYNHESPRRNSKFVTRKIIQGAVAILKNEQSSLVLGNLDAKIDWGYAPEYMEATHLIVQAEMATEFIVASGKLNSVRDFVQITFDKLGLDWQKFVVQSPDIITKKGGAILCGNISKIKSTLNWEPKVGIEEMIELMLQDELNGSLPNV